MSGVHPILAVLAAPRRATAHRGCHDSRDVRRRGLRLLRHISALLLLLGCGSDATVAPAIPRARPGTWTAPVLPSMPPSVVDAPVTYAIEPLLKALEAEVPRTFGNLEKRLPIDGRKSVAYTATRTPFAVGFEDGRLTLATTLSYKARGYFRPLIGPTVSAGCGTDDATPPRVRLVLRSDLRIDSSWQLVTRTRVASLTPATTTERDACKVTFLQLDVTDQVVRSVRPLVERQLPRVDRRMARVDVRRRVARWYAQLQKNFRITDSLWLQLMPGSVALGDITLDDSQLVANIRLRATPRLVSGEKPAELLRPLPSLNRAASDVGDSVHLNIEGLLDYQDAGAILTKKLAGRRVRRMGRTATVEHINFTPLGDGRVVLTATLGGSLRGNLYLVGTPQLDTVARALVVPDLDFDVATSDALVRGVTWFKRDDLVQWLRQGARFPLDNILERTRLKVEEALNRDLTDGVRLSGAVQTGRLVDVLVHPRWLVIRAVAAGTLALDVDRPIKRSRGATVRARTDSVNERR
ncbi:DUF4403 family protein [Gemmatimonas phototrophica]|uniref:DUF4403 family protein n=1 Tax=Gemmatimonas phototrophica TaxID=1379270 RepID=UPI000AD0A5BD|nr:DUF4403 family protein [Gemmatimonas phototrophica]